MMTTKDAARALGLKTTGAVRQLILEDKLKATKIGRDWMIEESEIERFKQEPRKVGRPKKKTNVATNVAGNQGAGDTPHHKP
jgi:excisionase family DNA binding protein